MSARRLFHSILFATALLIGMPASRAHAADPEIDSLRSTLDEVLQLTASYAENRGLAESHEALVQQRVDLAMMTDEDLEPLRTANVADLLLQLRDSLATADAGFASASRFKRSAGYVNGFSYEAPCNSNVSFEDENNLLYADLLLKNIAEAALAAAEYFCLQTVPIPFLGGSVNSSTACAILAGVEAALESAFEIGKFCTDDRSDQRVSNAQEKLSHVHDDVEDHKSNPTTGQNFRLSLLKTTLETRAATINSAVTNVDTDLTMRANTIHAQLVGHQTNLTTRANTIDASLAAHQANLTTRANTIDNEIDSVDADLTVQANEIDGEINDLLAKVNSEHTEELTLLRRLDVEKALAGARAVELVSLTLPASAQGDIDLVAQTVNQTITNFQAAGLDVHAAQAFYVEGNAQVTAGNYREAFRLYSSAYREATRGAQ